MSPFKRPEDRHRGEGHGNTEVETGVMLSQAKESAEDRRGKKAPPWRLQREHGPADTLILDV